MATNRHTFLRWILTIGPQWFRGFWGQRLMGTFGLLGDSVAEGARQATHGRYVDLETPFGAMRHIGADRGRPRYPSESAEHYRRRVAGGPDNGPSVWDQHLRRTSPDGLRDMFLSAGHDVEIVEQKDESDLSQWVDYGLRIHGHGEDPCVPYDWDLPSWDSGWAWDTKLPADLCREIRDIAKADAPARSRLSALFCPELSATLDLDHHWRADSGVTGGDVLTWTDQIGAVDLSSVGATLNASDAAFGGRESITAVAVMSSTIGIDHGDVSWTMIIVFKPDEPITTPSSLARVSGFGGGSPFITALLATSTAGNPMGYQEGISFEDIGEPGITGAQCLVFAFDDDADELRIYRNGQLVGVAADYSSVTGSLVGDFDVFNDTQFGRVAEIGLRFGEPPTADEIRRIGSYVADWYGLPNDASPFVSPWSGFDASWLVGDPDGLGRLSLTDWLSYRCETAETSSQQDAATVQTGYAANAPRAFSRDGVAFGLLVEPAATNLIDEQDVSAWGTIGAPTVTATTDPAGGSDAWQVEDDDGVSNEFVQQDISFDPSTTYTLSSWSWLVATTDISRLRIDTDLSPDVPVISVSAPDSGWVHRSDTDTTPEGPFAATQVRIFPGSSSVGSATGTLREWGMQLEQRVYPTSFIGADNATFTRAAGTLAIDSSRAAPFGYFDVAVTAQFLFASSEASGDVVLIAIDDATQLRYDGSDVVLVVDGTTVETVSGVSWSRDAVLSFRWRHAPGSRSITFEGQSSSTVGSQSAIVVGSEIELFGRGGASEAVAVRSIVARRVPS